jgi:ribosome-associated protein
MNGREVQIHTPFITLDQFLKWAGVTGTGGEAKASLAEGLVLVNGVEERRRGRKLYPGDTVQAGGDRLVITGGEE